ncbi:MAG: acetate--CoA ligase family protein [Oligoflexia bacterium]|nr:acetate--CoA ligase family protein [Oligoflexia bacterium]
MPININSINRINRELINPSSIAIIGGSNDVSTPGGKILKNITDNNYAGKLIVVNPKSAATGNVIQGVPSVATVKDLPASASAGIDLAIIAVRCQFIKEIVIELVREKKVKAYIILSAGFSEMGDEGRKLEQEIVSIIDEIDGSLIGPNCIGVLNTNYAGIFAGPIPKLDPKGVDFVSGSGATACFTIERGIQQGLTFASLFSVGNGAQIGVEDVLKYLDETFDPKSSSRVKMLYMENVKRPEMFLKHTSSLIAKGCMIAAVKAGQSEVGGRAASSHTGALANSDVAVDALFKRAGVARCFGRDDLINTAAIFSILSSKKNFKIESKNKRVAIITHAGGPGVLLTDILSNGGVQIPEMEGSDANELLSKLFSGSSVHNPIDFLATGTTEQLSTIIDYVDTRFDNIDMMAVIFGSTGLTDLKEPYELISQKMSSTKKPLFAIFPSPTSAGEAMEYFKNLRLGNLFFTDEVLFGRALVNVLNNNILISRSSEENLNLSISSANKAKIRQVVESKIKFEGYIDPASIKTILDCAEIYRVAEMEVKNIEEVVEIVEVCAKGGFSKVVMKVIGPLHKSDVGGVILGVDSSDSEKIKKNFKQLMKIEGATSVLIQPMLKGVELFLGAKREGDFGHIILCGLGGIFIEVLHDTAAAITSAAYTISYDQAMAMIKSLKGYKILEGVRGQQGVNVDLFAKAIIKLSQLLVVAPEISELDLNPLLGTKDDVIAVDARIKLSTK